MSTTLRISISEEKANVPVTVLTLIGDLDGKTYTELEAKAEDLINGGSTNLLFDLAQVGFMGSAGLRALHAVANKLKDVGEGQIMLLNPSDSVNRVFHTLGFDKFFTIHTDINTALNSF